MSLFWRPQITQFVSIKALEKWCLFKSTSNYSSWNFLYFASNPSLELRDVFMDLLKAFDKVWNDGLVSKFELFWKYSEINSKLFR